MKKVLLIVAALFVGLQANAQLRADGGFMHAMETFNWNGTKDGHTLDGGYLGAKYNIDLGNLVDGLSVEPGANLSLLFGKEDLVIDNYTVSELALNVPVHVRYTYGLTGDFNVYGLVGPTFSYGLNMHAGISRNPFNMYLGLAAGIEVAQMIHVNVGFDFGLLNMSSTSHLGIGRNVLKIGVGYIF